LSEFGSGCVCTIAIASKPAPTGFCRATFLRTHTYSVGAGLLAMAMVAAYKDPPPNVGEFSSNVRVYAACG